LKKRTEEVVAIYHVCQLVGDAESISVSPDVFEDIMNLPPGTDHTFQLAEESKYEEGQYQSPYIDWD
jgi:hypothetical protein